MLKLVKVAITGGPGSGKSTASQLFEEQGAYVVQADNIVHQLLSSRTEIIRKIVDLLGQKVVVAGQLDRKVIANITFNDHRLLLELEKILHPAVLKEIELCYQRVLSEKTHPLFIAEIPLLYEAHFEPFFDKVILIMAKQQICIERLLKKGKIACEEEYQQRYKRFLSDEKKSKWADVLIHNDGTIEELKEKIIDTYSGLKFE